METALWPIKSTTCSVTSSHPLPAHCGQFTEVNFAYKHTHFWDEGGNQSTQESNHTHREKIKLHTVRVEPESPVL